MYWPLLTILLLECYLKLALGGPVISLDSRYRKDSLAKRAVLGPEINGANFPDPSIILVNNIWYAFGTRSIGSSVRIQIATSTDFKTWTLVHNTDGSQRDALPTVPSWVVQRTDAATWAPDVNVLDDGTFVMYYCATTNADTTKHCIGAATSKTVLGPYTPSNEPLFCPLSQGGAIDPAGFYDNGQRYVVYKVDGNSIGHGGPCGNTVAPLVPTPLILQPVTPDGLTAQGKATTLLDHSNANDDGIVEAPSLVKSGSTYVLFFSPGCFTTNKIAYATSNSITGPYTRASAPLIQTGDHGLTAPGGADVTRGGDKIVFHANYGNGRALYTATIAINGKSVSLTA